MQAKAAGKTTDSKDSEKVREQILMELESAMAMRSPGKPSEESLSLDKSWHSPPLPSSQEMCGKRAQS